MLHRVFLILLIAVEMESCDERASPPPDDDTQLPLLTALRALALPKAVVADEPSAKPAAATEDVSLTMTTANPDTPSRPERLGELLLDDTFVLPEILTYLGLPSADWWWDGQARRTGAAAGAASVHPRWNETWKALFDRHLDTLPVRLPPEPHMKAYVQVWHLFKNDVPLNSVIPDETRQAAERELGFRLPTTEERAIRAQRLIELPRAVTVTKFRWNSDYYGYGGRGYDPNGLYTLARVRNGKPVYERYQMATDDHTKCQNRYTIEFVRPTDKSWQLDKIPDFGPHLPAWLLRSNRAHRDEMLYLMGVAASATDTLPPTQWPYGGTNRVANFYDVTNTVQSGPPGHSFYDGTNTVRGGPPLQLTFHK